MENDFFIHSFLDMTSRDDKLSIEPKMGSIASILSIWRFVEKCSKNNLPSKKSVFGHFLAKIDDLKIFLVALHVLICSVLIAHRNTRRSVKKLDPYH